jgi:hypothetical protein
MSVSVGGGPVLPALMNQHSNQKVFSYGISDSPGTGISLYKPGSTTGVLVNAKPGAVVLPPPFDAEETPGIGHEIHHKFIVCGFNKPDAVVWCGSSNLALGGEQANGDNLIRIDDTAIATVFAIEAVGLVDHFDFRDSLTKAKPLPAPGNPTTATGVSSAPTVTAVKGKPAKGAKGKPVKGRPVKSSQKPIAGRSTVKRHAALRPVPVRAKGKDAVKKKSPGAPVSPAVPAPPKGTPPATLNLHNDDSWVARYYDPKDLYCSDRLLFSNKL